MQSEHILLFGHFLSRRPWSVQIKFDRTGGVGPFLGLIQIDGMAGSPDLALRELVCMFPLVRTGFVWEEIGARERRSGGGGGSGFALLKDTTVVFENALPRVVIDLYSPT